MLNRNVMSADDAASRSLARGDRHGTVVEYARPGGDGDAGCVAPAFARSDIQSPGLRQHGRVIPEKVLQSFNTWAFKREQPADPQLMLQIISESIALGTPIPFVLYWGKGPRCKLDTPDVECLDYLTALTRRVQKAYAPGAGVRLIFTDTHAELNGHPLQSIHEYFGTVAADARQRGFESCWLGELVRAAQATPAPCNDDMPEETLRRLSACAAKWYRGDGTPEQGAAKYFQMNMTEKRAVELAFPRAIFITFNGSEYRNLFPERLPIFYMYSLRRGVSIKPWFLPTVAAPSITEGAGPR
jgi:hypothetical protein